MPVTSIVRVKAAPWLGVLLIIGVLVGYSNSLTIGYELDDGYLIPSNPAIRTLANIPRFFTDPTLFSTLQPSLDLRPILSITYAINYAISGNSPWSYHVVGILFHLVAAALVFVVVRDFVWVQGGDTGAILAALAFALAPLNGQPIIYQSARSVGLMAVFYLAAFYLILKDRVAWGLLCHALALLTKMVAVTLPGILLLYALLYRRTRKMLVVSVLAGIVDCLYLMYRSLVAPLTGALSSTHAAWMTPWVWFMTSWGSYVDYARRFIWPSDLSIDYQGTWVTTLAEPRAVIPLLLLVAWIAVAVWFRDRWPHLAFATGWYFLVLAPECTFFPLSETQNDHRPYLATMGLSIILAWALVNAVQTKALVPVCAVLALASVSVTYHRNWVWQDTVRLWQETARTQPGNGRAFMNAGVGLMGRGKFAEARRYFTEAKRLYPSYAYVEMNLSVLDRAEGKIDSAIAHGMEAVRLGGGARAQGYLDQALAAR